METVHNYEQIMTWKPDDLRGLIGSHITVHEAADDRAFWKDPLAYAGRWLPLGSGVVANIDYRPDSGGYSGRLIYAEGGSSGWISGQPIRMTETKD